MPSKFYVMFDPATGNITQRMSIGSEFQAQFMKNVIEITNEEFTAQPELHKRVDLESKKLVDK